MLIKTKTRFTSSWQKNWQFVFNFISAELDKNVNYTVKILSFKKKSYIDLKKIVSLYLEDENLALIGGN